MPMGARRGRNSRWKSRRCGPRPAGDRKSTRLNSSHTEIYTLSLHDALPILTGSVDIEVIARDADGREARTKFTVEIATLRASASRRSEEHTSELQSHRDLHSFPTRRSSDLDGVGGYRSDCARCRWARGADEIHGGNRDAAGLGQP